MAKGAQPSRDGLAEAAVSNPHAGHRERARQRFLQIGEQALQDYELLELVLQLAVPRRDTKGLAKELLARFGSFSAVFAATSEQLAEMKGLTEVTAANL